MSADEVVYDAAPGNDRYLTLLGSKRAAIIFAMTIFATTLVQVLSIPVMAYLGANTVWGLPLPEPAVIALLVFGCAAQAGSLLLTDHRPRLAAAVAVAVYLALALGLSVPSWLTGMYLVIAVAIFLLAARIPALPASLWALAVILVTMGVLFAGLLIEGIEITSTAGFVVGESARFAAPVAGAAALGIWWRVRVRQVALAREEAILAKQEHARLLVEAQRSERTRIAQELHDVAGQHLAGLITLAGAAMAIAPHHPERAIELVGQVRQEGQFAATSLSVALADLRATGAEPVDAGADLRQVTHLAEYWRRVGLPVSLTCVGAVEDLPAVVSSTGYRVLQESLTNVAKHAPGVTARVTLRVNSDALDVMVENTESTDGSQAIPGLSLGWGLSGMRDRVQLLGGSFEAAPTPDRGWRVRMSVPLASTTHDEG